MNSRAIIEPNGNVFWPPPTKFRSTTADVDMSNYIPNGEWDLLEADISRNVVYYPCCPEPFPDVTIRLTIRRKILYYTYNVILPCMMLSVLTLLVFCIPPDSGEKIALGVTVLLAFSVFMLAISEKLPETSESIPLLGIYLTVVMAITSVSVIMTVIVLNFHYRGPVKKKIPSWLKTLSTLSNSEPNKYSPQTKIIYFKSQNVANNYKSNSTQLFNAMSSNLTNEIQHRLLREHSKYKQNAQQTTGHNMSNSVGGHTPLDPYGGHRYALSTESLINIEDNYKLLLNLSRAKSCNRIANNMDTRSHTTGSTAVSVPPGAYDKLLQAHEELLDIICRYLMWENELKEHESSVIHEWRLLALFIDRILFWIFFIITFCSSVMFLVVIPIKQRDK
ncbi:unnamed protein product, partial [Medioppia subpectinata]